MTTPRGLFVVDVSDPMHPRIAGQLTNGFLKNPRCISVQFRYGFITDDDGLKVVDLTEPTRPAALPRATVRLNHAGTFHRRAHLRLYRERPRGLAIVDVENPEAPRLDQMFNAGGALNDTRAVQIGSVSASQYALVADGKTGCASCN